MRVLGVEEVTLCAIIQWQVESSCLVPSLYDVSSKRTTAIGKQLPTDMMPRPLQGTLGAVGLGKGGVGRWRRRRIERART